MRKLVGLLCAVCVMSIFASRLEAQQPADPARQTAIIEALQSQRNQANDAVAVCFADSRKEIADLKAKIAELEKPKDAPAKK